MAIYPADLAGEALMREARRRGLLGTSKKLASLVEFVAETHGFEQPHHLAPLVELFERIARGEEVRALVSTPPQHGKSQVVLHALVWLLLQQPRKRHAFATYAQAFSREQSGIAQLIADQHGLKLRRDTQDAWETTEGGRVAWTSRGGPLTGRPVDGLLLVDDLIKDREEANSPLIRKKAMGWLSSVAFTRMHPGASFVLIATRWHLDDPTGQLLKNDEHYEYIELPAISAAGEALWPSQRPLEWLEQQKQRLLPADWSAMFQCEPREEGTRVFPDSSYYDALPGGAYREAHGFDAAYSTKAASDWTVTLSGRRYGEKLYVTNMMRLQTGSRQYIELMKAAGIRRVHWYASSTERGLADLLRREGIEVQLLPTTSDKLVRATPAAVSWTRGDVVLPSNAPWVPKLEAEVLRFTGVGDEHDDIVDALAALHQALLAPSSTDPRDAKRASGLA